MRLRIAVEAARRASSPSNSASRAAAQRPRGALRLGAPAQRPVAGGRAAEHDPLAAPVQVDVALRRRRARFAAGRSSRISPISSSAAASSEPVIRHSIRVDLVERRLDARPLPVRSRSTSAAGRAGRGLADVEHPAVGVAEEVDARAGSGRRGSSVALGVDPPGPRRGELLELRRASRRRVPAASSTRRRKTSAVACASGSARWHGRTETPKKYASEARLVRSIAAAAGDSARAAPCRSPSPRAACRSSARARG